MTRDTWIRLCSAILSVSFTLASLLAFRYTNPALRVFYRGAAIWLGLLSFLFLAAHFLLDCFGGCAVAGWKIHFHPTVEILFATAIVVGLYGVFNANWTRITRTTVQLAKLA